MDYSAEAEVRALGSDDLARLQGAGPEGHSAEGEDPEEADSDQSLLVFPEQEEIELRNALAQENSEIEESAVCRLGACAVSRHFEFHKSTEFLLPNAGRLGERSSPVDRQHTPGAAPENTEPVRDVSDLFGDTEDWIGGEGGKPSGSANKISRKSAKTAFPLCKTMCFTWFRRV